MRRNPWQWGLMLAGLAGGFLYWKFVGCLTGSCPLQSVWYLSTLWGGLLGWALGGLFLGSGCGCAGNQCDS